MVRDDSKLCKKRYLRRCSATTLNYEKSTTHDYGPQQQQTMAFTSFAPPLSKMTLNYDGLTVIGYESF